jgi:predicted lipid-binding transport protein (Tim44 family)
MKPWLIGALMLALAATAVPHTAEAKRLGAGRPAGMQRNMPARTAPEAVPARPAAPQQTAPAAAPATPAAPPAAAPKRNWMGPLAGLAAGLGIGALLSHFGMGGMGGGFGSILTMLLLLGGGAFLVMFLLRRFGPGAQGAGVAPAMAGAGGSGMNAPVAWPQAAPREPVLQRESLASLPAPASASNGITPITPIPNAGPPTPPDTGVTRAFVPAAFDAEGFTRTAKLIFIRLQAANDTADLDDLRRFTTPELFASIRLDIQERGSQPQVTDVVKVDAEVLDVVNESDRQIVSVRFHGQVVEEKGAAATAFNEVWHLVKPHDDSHPWAIAGIEPLPA